MSKPRIAVSIGDLNGIGIEILFKAHETVSKFCRPLYFVGYEMAEQAAKLLNCNIPNDFEHVPPDTQSFTITPGIAKSDAGNYSFASFKKAVEYTGKGICEALVTLPINKEAWMHAGIGYKGHTDALRHFFQCDAIMMLGSEKLYVALFTEHIPLKEVPKKIEKGKLVRFLLDFQRETGAERIGVLGLNPHAGDHGVLGDEERTIEQAIHEANETLETQHSAPTTVFHGPLVPDIAFTPNMRQNFHYFVAMYHDQGLAPLKALYFDESINVSLNLPIVRTSVDHGTAFDIAYLPDRPVNLKSYIEAVRAAVAFSATRHQRS